MREAQADPATVEEVRAAKTADANKDGFVTLDEVIAMEKAGLTDLEIVKRLEATGQVFELTDAQKKQLRDAGVGEYVITRLDTINQKQRDELMKDRSDVISKPKPQ